jgi:hypothetical protein
MITYLLSSPSITSEGVFFSYKDGLLVRFDASDGVDSQQVKWLHDNLPLKHDDFTAFKAKIEGNKNRKAKIVEVGKDLSFEAFWETFNYKKGRKESCKRTWDAMSQADKVLAMDYIKVYKRFLGARPNQDSVYPQTFLNTAEWNN